MNLFFWGFESDVFLSLSSYLDTVESIRFFCFSFKALTWRGLGVKLAIVNKVNLKTGKKLDERKGTAVERTRQMNDEIAKKQGWQVIAPRA
ncbi:relaxase/mobilization nuclease domain-containing protein [Levilactobacillus brevis]